MIFTPGAAGYFEKAHEAFLEDTVGDLRAGGRRILLVALAVQRQTR
jgi:hypothetical protein